MYRRYGRWSIVGTANRQRRKPIQRPAPPRLIRPRKSQGHPAARSRCSPGHTAGPRSGQRPRPVRAFVEVGLQINRRGSLQAVKERGHVGSAGSRCCVGPIPPSRYRPAASPNQCRHACSHTGSTASADYSPWIPHTVGSPKTAAQLRAPPWSESDQLSAVRSLWHQPVFLRHSSSVSGGTPPCSTCRQASRSFIRRQRQRPRCRPLRRSALVLPATHGAPVCSGKGRASSPALLP